MWDALRAERAGRLAEGGVVEMVSEVVSALVVVLRQLVVISVDVMVMAVQFMVTCQTCQCQSSPSPL